MIKIWINGDSDIKGEFIDVRYELDLKKLIKTVFQYCIILVFKEIKF
jgi:hypothetical protein